MLLIVVRHKELIKTYQNLTDRDILKKNFQFLRDEEKDAEEKDENWEIRMSIKYYDRLYKEYALADLTRYKEGKIGLRWRTESEVTSGKGQFSCGNKTCSAETGLHSYELLFGYREQKEKKQCLVKVRACPPCALKLFYKKLGKRKRDLDPDLNPVEIHQIISQLQPEPSTSETDELSNLFL